MKLKKLFSVALGVTLSMSLILTSVASASETSKAPDRKDEQVLVETDATGNVISKRVNVTLTGADSKSPIKDKTNLKNVTNFGGGATYTQEKDGTLIWDNDGNEIKYIGDLETELPIDMNIQYFLNGQEMSASEIAGKSGRVEVRYNFENKARMNVEVDGKQYDTYASLLLTTCFALPKDSFQKVESLNGALVIEQNDDTYFLVAMVAPGLNKALNLEIMGLDHYVSFPESFGFVADVTNFAMPSTITTATTHAIDQFDFSSIETADDMNKEIDKLVNAGSQLADGAKQLSDGTGTLNEGVVEFLKAFQDGLTQISEGTMILDNELCNLEAKKKEIELQATELLAYLDNVIVEVEKFELPKEEDILTPELLEAEEKLAKDVEMLIKTLEAMQVQVEELQKFAEEAEDSLAKLEEAKKAIAIEFAAIDLDKITAEATELAKQQAIAAAQEELGGFGIPNEQLVAIANSIVSKIDISSVTAEAKSHVANIEKIMNDIPEIEIPEINVDIEPVIKILEDMEVQLLIMEGFADKQDEMVVMLSSANEFLTSVKEDSVIIREKSNELISGLDFADSAIKSAHDYMNTLNEALKGAEDGGQTLADGVSQVDEGANLLADSTNQFYREGVLTAADFAREATIGAFINRCKAVIVSAKEYNNISGIDAETEGSIYFTIRTAEVGTRK